MIARAGRGQGQRQRQLDTTQTIHSHSPLHAFINLTLDARSKLLGDSDIACHSDTIHCT